MTLSSYDAGAEQLVLEEGMKLARKYKLLRPAGFGGMAQLWAARNEATGAEVCIKVLVPENMDDEPVKRFRREAHAAARLSHRAIVRTFDLLELDAQGDLASKNAVALGLVMELLKGETLGDVLLTRGALPLEEALDIALPVSSALAHAHRAGIVHRDLKPDNIFLATDPDGQLIPKVLDFGISKVSSGTGNTAALTMDGVMLGTPTFMSPEQAKGAKTVDARSDVFSFGIVLYLMLSGKNPFEAGSLHDVITAILERQPPRLENVPDAIWAVLARALDKDPTKRYADATELGIALRKAAGRRTDTESDRWSIEVAPSSASSPPVASSVREPVVTPAAEESEPQLPLRKPPVKLVVGILAGAAALILAAVVRMAVAGPDDGATTRHDPARAPTATTSAAPQPLVTANTITIPTATATVEPSATAAATGTATAAVNPMPRMTATTATATATAEPSAVATTFDVDPAPRRTAKPAPPPPTATATATSTGGGTIVRDPGF